MADKFYSGSALISEQARKQHMLTTAIIKTSMGGRAAALIIRHNYSHKD